MRVISRVLITAAVAVGASVAAAPAAHASTPAVTGCAFTPLYETYENGQLSDLDGYIPGTRNLTVTEGDGHAWFVTVLDGTNRTGWMPTECVLFLA